MNQRCRGVSSLNACRKTPKTNQKELFFLMLFLLEKTVSLKILILVALTCIIASSAISVYLTNEKIKREQEMRRRVFFGAPSKTIVGDEPPVPWR